MITPKQAYIMVKRLNAGINDPMTQYYGADEFVGQAFNDKCRSLGTSPEKVEDMAYCYEVKRRERRTRFKDPHRLEWKQQRGNERLEARMVGEGYGHFGRH